LYTEDFNHVSYPNTTSGLHVSRAFQQSSFFAGRLKKFSIRIHKLFVGVETAGLIGEDIDSRVESMAYQ